MLGVSLPQYWIGVFASYVALDLAKRLHNEERASAFVWWICGSLAMGTGVWSMHFVGMLAFSLPIALGYTLGLTFLSWVAAVTVSAIAMAVASRGVLTTSRLAMGSVLMGGGICAMHYTGMAALDMAPAIVWNPVWITVSVLIAVGASAAALRIFFWLRTARTDRALRYQVAAAAVMGLAICGMHYTGMAAANFPAAAVCLSAAKLGGDTLGTLVIVLTMSLLGLTLCVSLLDVRRRLALSLKAANEQLQLANQELHQRALIDPLTALPNRVLLEDRLAQAVARRERASMATVGGAAEQLAVLFLDLDGFKPVNDSYGHSAGDQVLVEVAARLRRASRTVDTVARLGGDEFVVLMEVVADERDCIHFANRLLQSLSAPFTVGSGHHVQISASVGIAIYPEHGQGDELLVRADAVMYAAKRAGRANFALFEPYSNSR